MSAYRLVAAAFLTMLCFSLAPAQSTETLLEKLMLEYEQDVVDTYVELEQLIEFDPNPIEQESFEHLVDVYVNRIMEIYSTIHRLRGFTSESYRSAAARALIFRALTLLERVDFAPENYEKACADYRRALALYQSGSHIPIMNKRLPYEIWIGRKLYSRLADLLDSRKKNFQFLDCQRQENHDK